MGIVDLHFHDSEFSWHIGEQYEGVESAVGGEGEAEDEESGGFPLVAAGLAALGAVVAVGVGAFLVKKKLGGGDTAESTLSDFEGDEDVA